MGSVENRAGDELRGKLDLAAAASRDRKIRTGLINASSEMMKTRDFSRPAISDLVQAKCDKALSTLFAG